MKYTLIFLLLSGILNFFSCASNSENNNNNTFESEGSKDNDTLANISGSWISENYYTSINNFKSPKVAQDNSIYIVIPEKAMAKTFLVFNFHEGGPYLKVIKQNSSYRLWKFEEDSLKKRTMEIEIISPTKIKIDSTVFIKISEVANEGNDLILEELLFKGKYKNGKGNLVELKADGKIIGLENFNYYKPIIDYYDEGMNVDQLYLGKISNNSERMGYKFSDLYGFKFLGDTLDLFKLNCVEFDSTSNNCGIVEFGDRIDRLIKEGKN